MNKRSVFQAATLVAAAGIGLATAAPFLLDAPGILPRLGAISWVLFAALGASALISAAAKAGKLQLVQGALGLRLRFATTLAMTLIADSAFLISPWGAAGFGANIGLLQRAGASWASATMVVGADQALDLAFFAAAVPLAALFALSRLNEIVPAHHRPLLMAVLLGTVLVGALLWACRRPLLKLFKQGCRRLPWIEARRARLIVFRDTLRAHVATLRRMSRARLLALLMLTTLQWLLRYGALWLILLELGRPVSLGFVLAAQALILHAALWTGVPAGGGGGDLALAAAFAPWVPRADMAVALVLWRFATLYCPLLLGGIALAVLARRRAAKAPVLD